jgi:hypothetical protein
VDVRYARDKRGRNFEGEFERLSYGLGTCSAERISKGELGPKKLGSARLWRDAHISKNELGSPSPICGRTSTFRKMNSSLKARGSGHRARNGTFGKTNLESRKGGSDHLLLKYRNSQVEIRARHARLADAAAVPARLATANPGWQRGIFWLRICNQFVLSISRLQQSRHPGVRSGRGNIAASPPAPPPARSGRSRSAH